MSNIERSQFMQLTKPKMIIFDAGRTLINYKEINIRKGTEAYYPYIISNPHQYTVEEIEKYDDEIFGSFDLCRENRFEIPMENKLRLLFDLLEIQFSISLNEVAKIEWEEDPVIEAVNHAADLLHWLNGAKIRTAVISNCDYSGNLLQEKLNKIFPENQFEFVIASSDYGVMKPNHYIFQAGIVKSGLEAKDIWYVGDKVAVDVLGSKAAGMTPVLYKNPRNTYEEIPENVIVVDDLMKIASLLTQQ